MPSMRLDSVQMDGVQPDDDPFSWSIERVFEELCAPGRPWIQGSSLLGEKVLEEEVDGQTLLTYEFLYSRKELMECLDVKTARRRTALADAIVSLQARSQAFRSWKKDFMKKQTVESSDDEEPKGTGKKTTVAALNQGFPKSPSAKATDSIPSPNQSEPRPAIDSEHHEALRSSSTVPFRQDQATSDELPNGEASLALEAPSLSQTSAASVPTSTSVDEERAPKRRRLALTKLSTQPLVRTSSPSSAYLGTEIFNLSAAETIGSMWIETQGRDFAVVSTMRLPVGQRIVLGRTLKNVFISNSRKEALLKQGIVPMRSPTPSDRSESIIDLEDLPDSWDEDTMREIEDEEAEIAARDRELGRRLPQDRVEAILREELEGMNLRWDEKKRPKHERKAYSIWMDARRHERTKKKIFYAQHQAEMYDKRIKKLCAEILKDTWQKEQDVRTQAQIMQQNVDDKLYHLWFIELLESRVQPLKPQGNLNPTTPKAKSVFMDDEILTSSGEDDFIVPDEESEAEPIVETPLQNLDLSRDQSLDNSSPAFDQDPSMYVDLTQVDSPERLSNSEATRVYIDLRSPIKPKTELVSPILPLQTDDDSLADAPPIEDLGSFETIGQYPDSFWSKKKDRWRLIICLIWKLAHVRRQGLLRAFNENSVEDVWRANVRRQLLRPLTQASQLGKDQAQTVAFDMTRVFLSFVRCRQCKESRIMSLDKKDKSRLHRAEAGLFLDFCAFVKAISPSFPQDSQVFRTDLYDEEIGLDEDDEIHAELADTPSKSRKVHEIVQNKEGVDLREREKRRAEEQEARRMKLRAALATSNLMPQDKTRLIINESKQDDQAFVYVNDEIGMRIKDHQINGVRFLWNQIILDTQERQGCLLAHTMGLGKTMQVITFLVAIVEAALSEDTTAQSQIPEDLRAPQTLVLCPAGLVDNWIDEILLWAPTGLLGHLRKVEAAQKEEQLRLMTIRDWGQTGGVLVLGYEMFKNICAAHEDAEEILTQKPRIVIADEAHMLKNPGTRIHQACSKFRTTRRIALTGSPLANNVEEYYSMINWVAPNFLGPLEEFRRIYANPIQHGLWVESTLYDRRKALKMLEVLKMNVAPKMQRATIQCIRDDLPPKYEFVIFVEPTPMQKRLYNLYVHSLTAEKVATGGVFNYLTDLGLVCSHPRCFRQKALEIRQKSVAAHGNSLTSQDQAIHEQNQLAEEGAVGEQSKRSTFPENIISAVLKETNVHDLYDPSLSRKVELLIMILDEARKVQDKVLIFSQSIPTLDYLESLFQMQQRLVCRLDGSTAVSKRQDMIKGFNIGKQEVYLISTRAGGVGLNIQGANRVVIFDFKWNPVNDQQAVGRAYRFGQKKTVFVYQFLIAGTFEEQLQNKAVFKMQLASRVVDKKNPVSWGKRLTNLLQPIQPTASEDLSPFLNRDHILDKLIRYNSAGEGIRQIVSTDTFEEEDSQNQLTAEEQKDAKELHDLERLRHTDRERYEKLMDEKRKVEQIRAFAHAASARDFPSSQPGPSTSQRPGYSDVNQSTDGAFDEPSAVLPTPPSSSMPLGLLLNDRSAMNGARIPAAFAPPPSTAPLPMAGANTYFGQSVEPASSDRSVPVATKGGLFGQPRSQVKDEFRKKLTAIVQNLERSGTISIGETPNAISTSITEAIDRIRKDESLGFLPDHQRWRLLLDNMSTHERFAPATISNVWTAGFLALAAEQDIQHRMTVLNGLSEEQFQLHLRRSLRAPDPENLHNVSRPNAQSFRAREDMRVMQDAVDKRRERAFRLPAWANEALVGNRGDAS